MKYTYYLVFLLFISGCSSNSGNTTFDLDRNNLKSSPNLGVNVTPRFSSALPSSTKMIFYFKSNEVRYDMFNNWAQTPQDLLARHFMLYFNNPEKQIEKTAIENCILSGTIYDFECDTNSKEAIFTVEITISDQNENLLMSKLYTSRANLEKLTASDFSIAMSLAVNKAAKLIYQDIQNLKK